MQLHDELREALDGVPIGRGSLQVVCDLPHSVPKAVDVDDRVQYECIRIDEAQTIYARVGYPCYDVWIADLLRCADCEIESLSAPTKDYDEALVELDIGWDGEQHVLDASDMTVLDYSPADDGVDPEGVPTSLVQTMLDRRDPGMLRRSRMARSATRLRERGAEELATQIEAQLDD